MSKQRIIIVDDEKDMRDFLEIMLRKEGYDALGVESAPVALEEIKSRGADLVISDVRMPVMGGVDFLKAMKEMDPEALVVMITAYASVETAIDAMKAGAYDYFTKPFNIDEVKFTVRKALELKRLERENRLLKNELKSRLGFSNIIGTSPRMAEVYSLIMSVAKTRTNVFISGESGTGKELIARAIHNESDRKDRPFVAVNCGAIPENLLESELFGHVRGAFTGAVASREGLAEQADGGTLFLDEITELPLHLQVKLLRFIQERSFRRVGGGNDISVDIRLVAASNRDVESEVKAGRFREDLFYRLNVIRIAMPPLRERKEDIPHLCRHFLEKYNKALAKDVKKISEEAMRSLMDYDYSGNVRELENIIERSVTLEEGTEAALESLPDHLRAPQPSLPALSVVPVGAQGLGVPDGGMDLEKTVEDFEKAIITDALKKAGGVKKRAAELLGLSFRSMRYKLSKYAIHED
ncbi:MAG TPA: Fis family transcriptional regulator [Deltaproteobacteria bacterium]|nr:MAG: Fis family transcriptional regulator [Deltaproteobacteria bacterium GWA2_55_82]OGQ64695.1 MAG: Fis family transcriptional regulator [Deltaproteobacteria bacterium RIFCSPLOWO2_02_FULL_55_12]OIJ73167.1 MAG: Fis family transcriptional regulator [Deltaproteobacteria bacterium GWC2_55_46]HBG45578.1 Fis family transcriptional regulator [Deltaproteobacteria bacterium]HCY10409.1 Fis family transcriptional regulator [Deltaproteobacteria bacterium]